MKIHKLGEDFEREIDMDDSWLNDEPEEEPDFDDPMFWVNIED